MSDNGAKRELEATFTAWKEVVNTRDLHAFGRRLRRELRHCPPAARALHTPKKEKYYKGSTAALRAGQEGLRMDAITLLKKDHKTVKALFQVFK
jgi:hypothetical protein